MTSEDHIKELVDQAKCGDRASYDRLVQEYRAKLESWIRLRLGSRLEKKVEVDDVYQETVTHGLKGIQNLEWRSQESFYRWLCTVAERVILRVAEADRKRPLLRLRHDAPAAGPSPSKAMRRSDRFDRLQEALEGLSPDHREVIILARLKGLSMREIAQRMNRSPAAVSMLLTRALRSLRASFGDTESLHLPHRRLDCEEGTDNEEERE